MWGGCAVRLYGRLYGRGNSPFSVRITFTLGIFGLSSEEDEDDEDEEDEDEAEEEGTEEKAHVCGSPSAPAFLGCPHLLHLYGFRVPVFFSSSEGAGPLPPPSPATLAPPIMAVCLCTSSIDRHRFPSGAW